jgi:hypothetical protein
MIDSKNKDLRLFAISFIFVSILIVVSRFVYSFNDVILFIKDTLGNIGGVPVAAFFFIWYSNYSDKRPDTFKKRFTIILAVTVGIIFYEVLQKVLPWMTFDLKDIYGSLIGFTIAILLNMILITRRSR